MYPQSHLTDEYHIDLLINHTGKVITNHRNLVSRLLSCDKYQQQMLEAQIEATWQQLTEHCDKLAAAKEAVMQTITAIEHDYGKLCDDMANIGSDSARHKYDQAISQLENTHRQKLSFYELITANLSELESVISSAHTAVKTERLIDLPDRRSINKPVVDKDINNLFELDLLRKDKSGSSKLCSETIVDTIKPEESANIIINPEKIYTWDNESPIIRPDTPDSSCDLRESLPSGYNDLKDNLDIAAEKMEDVLVERSYKVLDYAPGRVNSVIDYTHLLSKRLKEYCGYLTPIPSLDRIDANIEDEYAIAYNYQHSLYNAVGLLYEYRTAAESELRWVQANKAIVAENPSPDSLLPNTAPDILDGYEKQHTAAIEKIDVELKSLEALIASFDRKSFPYRNPEENTRSVSHNKAAESTQPETKITLSLDSTENQQTEAALRSASGHSTNSAIYLYRYRNFRDGGTLDLLATTKKCIEHLLKFNEILPAVDMNGYSECIQAESQYALKEKHKLDLLQMIGHLNAHRAELTSEITKLTFWISQLWLQQM